MVPSKKNQLQIDQNSVARIKEEVKEALAKIAPDERLEYIGTETKLLENRTEPEDLIRHFVLLIHLLLIGTKSQSLRQNEVRQLSKKAYSLLLLAGIKPGNSLLSNLYGELHLALAQNSRHAGRHIDAFWQQQLAMVQSRRAPVGGEVFQNINLGIRAERLGHFQLSSSFFRSALEAATQPQDLSKIRIHLLRQARITGDWESFEATARQIENSDGVDQGALDELHWERCLKQYLTEHSTDTLLAALRRDSPQYDLSYIAEAKLLSFAVQSSDLSANLAKISTYQKNLGLRKAARDSRIDIITGFESAYDGDTPFAIRLRDLGEVLQRVAELPTIDLELLTWLAAARWLARNNNFEMAKFCVAEYQAICLRITAGASPDPTGLISDLVGRSWLQRAVASF
jgi:hypothetical protein